LTTLTLKQLAALQGDTVVLVPNDNAARQLRDKLSQERGSHEQALLETIAIMPVEQWMAELWDSMFPDKQVLRPIQVQALATSVIDASGLLPPTCLSPASITRQFVKAFNLHAEYALPDDREAYLFTPEYEAFSEWRDALQEALDQHAALTSSQLPAELSQRLASGELSLPQSLVVSDQLSFAPSITTFLEMAAERGLAQYTLVANQDAATPSVVPCSLRHDECEAIAAWAVESLASNPQANAIVVAVPDMQAYHAPLENALARALHPAALCPAGDLPATPPWKFVGADTLMTQPSIRAAWDIISLTNHSLPTEHLSRVLRSRFVEGWPASRHPRAALDVHWRDWLGPQASLTRALNNLNRGIEDPVEHLGFMLRLQETLATQPGNQLPSSWVRFFDQMLLSAGWPNTSPEDASVVLVQCLRGLSQSLDVFRAMDPQLGEVSHSEALSWLQHILSTKRFAISVEWQTPVRIMTYADAVGMTCDALWIAGLDDSTFPARCEPNPFLPLVLQQAAAIPDADPTAALARDSAILESLLTSTPNVVVSYAKQDELGAPAHISALVAGAEEGAAPVFQPAISFKATLQQHDQDRVAAVPTGELHQLTGGTSLFKEYAASPLFAFLKYRLGLNEFPVIKEGLDQRVQGNLLHAVMQAFWSETKSKDMLDRMTDLQVQELVERCIESVFSSTKYPWGRYGKAVVALEKRRIATVVAAWISNVERNRAEPFVVIDVERQRKTTFMGIPISIAIDRVDNVGGKALLIDYKSGNIEPKKLNSTELEEPQLPIYAIAESEHGVEVQGILLASLKSADAMKTHMRGSTKDPVLQTVSARGNTVDSPEKWAAELMAWRSTLEGYANGILAGNIQHKTTTDHSRGFSAYLLPLLRGQTESDIEG
jgi:ATP-dependent helicase/nuclease subunit B